MLKNFFPYRSVDSEFNIAFPLMNHILDDNSRSINVHRICDRRISNRFSAHINQSGFVVGICDLKLW